MAHPWNAPAENGRGSCKAPGGPHHRCHIFLIIRENTRRGRYYGRGISRIRQDLARQSIAMTASLFWQERLRHRIFFQRLRGREKAAAVPFAASSGQCARRSFLPSDVSAQDPDRLGRGRDVGEKGRFQHIRREQPPAFIAYHAAVNLELARYEGHRSGWVSPDRLPRKFSASAEGLRSASSSLCVRPVNPSMTAPSPSMFRTFWRSVQSQRLPVFSFSTVQLGFTNNRSSLGPFLWQMVPGHVWNCGASLLHSLLLWATCIVQPQTYRRGTWFWVFARG